MQKIRINDLARELEVKSKAILDALVKVGVTEKKTHSSSIEVDEAERVKQYFAEHAEPGSSGRRSSRTAPAVEEFKAKIDLSHISKPGDVRKLVEQRAVQSTVVPRPAAPPTQVMPRQTVAPPPAVTVKPVPPIAKPIAPAASTATVTPEANKPAPRFITPQPTVRQPSAVIAPPKPPAVKPVQTRVVAEAARPSEPTIEDQVAVLEEVEAALSETEAAEVEIPVEREREVAAKPASPVPASPRPAPPARPGQAAATQAPRRLIVPQTGPRPVYLAPPGTARPTANGVPRGGMPERGKPIFQRARPGVAPPGVTRTPVRPGERRGPHPTRSGAPGARPGFGPGAGGAPPPTGQRPAGRPARPGQRYVPRGVKEGPMKGFVPPPRLSLSSEPLPITRSITIPEGISVKDLAEKLEIRAKDL